MSKTDEELLNPTVSIVSKAAKTTNEAAAAVEEISFSSSLAAPSCSNKHQPTNTSSSMSTAVTNNDRQTPKSQRSTSKRSTSNKSNAKRVYVSDTATSKEHYFDANSLNSNSSHDDNSTSYALNHKPANNVPPVSNDNIIITTTNATTTGASLNNSNYNIFNNNSNSYVDNVITRDPIVIRGAGNITIFGVCNKFNEQFPSQLNAKLAPEEFRDTIKQINSILNKELENSFKWLVFGSIFCCCTLGCSLLPVIYMNKKAKLSINKLLDMENQRLYLKLGLKWRLAKLKCNSNSLLEYALLIEFLPTLLLYQPD